MLVLLFDRIEDFTPPEIAAIIATQLPGSALRVPIRVGKTKRLSSDTAGIG
jgi:hypothetical protein